MKFQKLEILNENIKEFVHERLHYRNNTFHKNIYEDLESKKKKKKKHLRHSPARSLTRTHVYPASHARAPCLWKVSERESLEERTRAWIDRIKLELSEINTKERSRVGEDGTLRRRLHRKNLNFDSYSRI